MHRHKRKHPTHRCRIAAGAVLAMTATTPLIAQSTLESDELDWLIAPSATPAPTTAPTAAAPTTTAPTTTGTQTAEAESFQPLETIPVAQEAAAPVPTARPAPAHLEEIVVTARKREERLVDVPESVQAFDGDTLQSSGVTSVKDLSRLTPNFAVIEAQQPGVVLINVRGIGQIRMGEAPIAVVVDGVQSNIPNQITQDLYDIERIEVLKGPQGSIYGRNAIGGAINIVTQQPTNEFSGKLLGTWGNGGDRRIAAQLSGPIIEDLLKFRVAGKYREFGGLIYGETIGENVDFEEVKTARASLMFTPTDDFSMTLSGSIDEIEAGAAYYVPYSILRALGRAGRDPSEISKPRAVVGDHKGWATRRIEDASLRMEWDTSFGTLSSVSAYSTLDSYLDEELDYTRLPLLTAIQSVENEALSQELRLSSNSGGAFDWLFGVYYLKVDRHTVTQPYIAEDVTALLGLPFNIPFIRKEFADDNHAYAGFANVGYQFRNGFEISAGFRYDVDEREQLSITDNFLGNATFRSMQPKVSLNYKFEPTGFADDAMLYTSVGKGFRSGGFNPSDKVGRTFDKEETLNYELGLKSRLWGNTQFNIATFYTSITDRQVYTLDLLTVSQLIANPVPKAHIVGAELELTIRPFTQLVVGLGGGVLRSKIDEYDPTVYAGTVARGDFTGNQLNQVPGYSYTAFFEYTQPIASLELIARGDFNGSGGDYYWEINNNDLRAPQNFANFRLTLKGEHWSLSSFVDNAFDEKFVAEYVPYEFSGGLSDLGMPGRPRRYGVELGFSF